jgi:hypothetical protein
LPFDLRPDGTQYFVRIDYKNTNNDLKIYIDTTRAFQTPVMEITSFDIKSYVSLFEDIAAYVGITTATGDSWEIHDLLDWRFCSYTDSLYVSVEDVQEPEQNLMQLVYPNPAGDNLNINMDTEFGRIDQIYIYDLNGKLILKEKSTEMIYVGNLVPGYYLCVIKKGNKTVSVPLIKN